MTTQFLRMPSVEYFHSPEILSVNQLLSGLWKTFVLDLKILQIFLSNLGSDFPGRGIHISRVVVKGR